MIFNNSDIGSESKEIKVIKTMILIHIIISSINLCFMQ